MYWKSERDSKAFSAEVRSLIFGTFLAVTNVKFEYERESKQSVSFVC